MMVSTFASKQEGPGFKSTVWLGPVCCSHWVLWLLPTVQLLRLISDSELPIDVSVRLGAYPGFTLLLVLW